jgi:hypothetical protein
MPSVSETASKCHICRKTVTQLRDRHEWEKRRLKILAKAEAELDKKRVASTVSKADIYENIEKAGLNFIMSRMFQDESGKVMLDLKPSEIVQMGKHAQLLGGDPDSRPDMGSDGRLVKVIVNLGDNGMIRENGKTDKDND